MDSGVSMSASAEIVRIDVGASFSGDAGRIVSFSLVVITCSSVFLGIIGSPFLYFDMMDALSAMTISGCGFVDVFFLVLCMGADHSSLFCTLHAGIWSVAFTYCNFLLFGCSEKSYLPTFRIFCPRKIIRAWSNGRRRTSSGVKSFRFPTDAVSLYCGE